MNICRFLFAVLLIAAAPPALAQEDVSGTWAGDLPVGQDTTLEIHFVLTRTPDGGYSAVLTSPNPDGIQNVPATSTSFEDNRLVVTVDALSGRYEGVYENGGFAGNWQQQGSEIPLDLEPYVESTLSDEAKEALRGSWVGALDVPQANLTLAIVFRFEDNDAGEFVGFFDSPDEGATGIPISEIELDDGEITLTMAMPQARVEYTGTFSGDAMDGTFGVAGQRMPLDMTRGEYTARGIELSREAIDRLEGSWVGRVSNPAGSLAIVFRFEQGADGGLLAYLDSPEQGARGIPMTEVTFEGDRLSLVVPAAQASFTGTLAGDEITGNWAQGNMTQPVTMTRGEYQPAAAGLDLSDEAFERLAGAWRGQMGPRELVIRVERMPGGEPVALLDVPAQGVSGMTVRQAELDADQVTFAIPAIGATLNGTLSGNEIRGQWQQGQANNPVTLTRDP